MTTPGLPQPEGGQAKPGAEKRSEIQWLRALAAGEVVICHSALVTKHFSTQVFTPDWYQPLSALGVELFFIVSGYVICMKVAPSDRAGPFLASRIARLYPMYWIFTSLAVLAFLINPAWHLNRFTPDLVSMAKSYLILPQSGFPILGVGWTLEHEMIFYVSVAAMLLTCGAGPSARLGLAWMLAICGAIGLALGGAPAATIAGTPGAGTSAWISHILSPFMLAFGFGWLVRVIEGMPWQGKALHALPFALAVATGLSFASDWTLMAAYRMAVAALLFAGFLAARSLFVDNSVNRLVWKLGDASFSIYLSHWFVLSALGKLLGALDAPAALDLPARLLGIAVSIAVGVAVFDALERPIDRALRRRSAAAGSAVALPGTLPLPVAIDRRVREGP